ncbi:MAG: helix-turn-helix domain-containing protein [Candidatus Rokuibacteriota bacterium]
MTGKELRGLRDLLELTQAQLAARLGVTPTSVARWERGERAISEPVARLVKFLVDTARKVTVSRPTQRRRGVTLPAIREATARRARRPRTLER